MIQPSRSSAPSDSTTAANPRSPRLVPPRGPTYEGRIYENDLNADPRWALSEGSRFFEGGGRVWEALAKITQRLNALGVPYCVVGGMALFQHGYRRFTEDVVILVTREGLKKIHEELSGLGYLPPFNRSKNLRDVELGVRVEFLITGEFPGDGKPKPVAFPDPAEAGIDQDGIRYINLPRLLELKLASGMTNLDRMKDLADAYELIKLSNPSRDFGELLSPFVRARYDELWLRSRKRYARLALEGDSIAAMLADGVTIDEAKSEIHGAPYLVTTDPTIAKKYDMHDESEFWDAGDGLAPEP